MSTAWIFDVVSHIFNVAVIKLVYCVNSHVTSNFSFFVHILIVVVVVQLPFQIRKWTR